MLTAACEESDEPELTSVLDVRDSLNRSRWVSSPVCPEQVTQIAQSYGLPEFVARMLCARGVEPDGVQAFLFPTLKDHFPDPFAMAGMRAFAEDMAQAVTDGRRIGILADFDVDGATSAAILTRFFRHLGQEVPVYIPDRLSEGYGPSEKAFQSLKEQGAEYVILADCGITAHEPVAAGRALGLDIAIFDHHEPEETLPDANHIINPKRRDDTSGLEMLAACGVSFLSCVAVNKALRERGGFEQIKKGEAPLKSWLDLVGLGTVCDMVPLTGPNRLFVRFGFAQMAQQNNPGIRALCGVANLETAPQVSDAGFVLGPRINAGSRVHKSDLGARLLSTDDLEEAQSIAWTLEECNEQRKDIQSGMMEEAVAQVEREGLDQNPVLIVGNENWHPGLSGLVAGRLKDRYGKPAVVITYAKTESGTVEGRGSGRSVPGVNMAQLFIEARDAGLLVKGGGHAMAGGFTILPDRLPEFQDFLYRKAADQMAGVEPVQDTVIDGVVSVRGARLDFIRLLQDNVGPFGIGNEEPVFALANVRLHAVDVLKDKHIRMQFSDWEGGSRMKAMLFYGVGTDLGEALLKQTRRPFHLAGTFQINCWQGRESVELHLCDGALAG